MKPIQLLAQATLFFGALASDARAATYTVTDLGTFGGSTSIGLGINTSGKVTGYAQLPGPFGGGDYHAFTYDGTMHDLGAASFGGSGTFGRGINDSGQVTGNTSAGTSFLYDGTMHNIGTLGGTQTVAYGINDSGQVTGYSELAGGGGGPPHAFLYDGTMHDLGTLPGGYNSFGSAINASGQVAGYANLPGFGYLHAVLYDGTMHDLGTLGGLNSFGQGINASGHVTGDAQLTGGTRSDAFLYNGTMHDLGTLPGFDSHGLGINVNDQVVGFLSQPDSTLAVHAFIYDPVHGIVDLNSLISPASGWVLTQASAINDAGWITGEGVIGGQQHAFLLTPIVPEPSNIALAACGAVALLGHCWRTRCRKSLGACTG